jgi:hypothetical protein
VSAPARVPRNLLSATSNPTGPNLIAGDMYFYSTGNAIRIYNGSQWVELVNAYGTQTIGGHKTFNNAPVMPAAAIEEASIRIPHGSAPGSPNDGDIWTTTAGIYIRVNGSTVGPLISAASLPSLSGYVTKSGTNTISATNTFDGPNYFTGYPLISSNVTTGSYNLNISKGSSTTTYSIVVNNDGLELDVFRVDWNGVVDASSTVKAGASTTSASSFRAPHGTAPSSPTDGDIWTTTAGLYVRINGSTVGPLSSGGSLTYATTSELANVTAAAEDAGASTTVARGDHKHDISVATAIALTGSAGTGSSSSVARADHQHGTSGLVLTTTNQTIGGAKTFQTSGATAVTIDQNSSDAGPYFQVRNSSAASILSATLTGGSADVSVGGTLAGLLNVHSTAGYVNLRASDATGGGQVKDSPTLYFNAQYWSGSATTDSPVSVRAVQQAAAANSTDLQLSGARQVHFYQSPLKLTGPTGATTVTRWVGGTSGSAPASGTWTVGDWVVTTDGKIYVCTSAGTPGTWVPVGTAMPLIFSVNGYLGVATGIARLGVEADYTILGVRARVYTSPTGSSILVDVNKNGTTIFTTQGNRPSIAASGNASSYVTNMNVTSLSAGDYLSVDVDQVGSTNAGSHMTVVVWVIPA